MLFGLVCQNVFGTDCMIAQFWYSLTLKFPEITSTGNYIYKTVSYLADSGWSSSSSDSGCTSLFTGFSCLILLD